MLPQPPPNAPAPPPSDAALLSRRKWRWIWVTGVLPIIALLFWMTRPVVIRSHRNPDQAEAVSNARQIGLALFEFDAEYGKYPDEATLARVREKTGTDLKLSTKSSNDFFRQLLACGFTQSERMFYAKIPGARKPDDVIAGKEALKKGEVGFSYLSGLSSEGNPSRPLVVTPLIPGTDRFDPKPFDGKAIILRMDNSVTSMNIINKDGHVMLDGRNLLDPSHPIWDGHPPRIVWPEFNTESNDHAATTTAQRACSATVRSGASFAPVVGVAVCDRRIGDRRSNFVADGISPLRPLPWRAPSPWVRSNRGCQQCPADWSRFIRV
jgi:hypothetical protein